MNIEPIKNKSNQTTKGFECSQCYRTFKKNQLVNQIGRCLCGSKIVRFTRKEQRKQHQSDFNSPWFETHIRKESGISKSKVRFNENKYNKQKKFLNKVFVVLLLLGIVVLEFGITLYVIFNSA